MCVHLSQDLHTWRKVLASWGMSQCVFTHIGDHLVEGRHANMLHCWWFLCLVHIHQSPENITTVFLIFIVMWIIFFISVALSVCLYWRDKVLGVDSSLGQALRWRSHGVGLKLLDVSAQWSYLSLHCLLSLDTLTLCGYRDSTQTKYTSR